MGKHFWRKLIFNKSTNTFVGREIVTRLSYSLNPYGGGHRYRASLSATTYSDKKSHFLTVSSAPSFPSTSNAASDGSTPGSASIRHRLTISHVREHCLNRTLRPATEQTTTEVEQVEVEVAEIEKRLKCQETKSRHHQSSKALLA